MKKLLSLVLALALCLGVALPAGAMTGMANPWIDTTLEAAQEMIGVVLVPPENAQIGAYRILSEKNLLELHMLWNGVEYTARLQPTDGFEDISGLHYDSWLSDEACAVRRAEGRLMTTVDGEKNVGLCLWYDAAPGLMYSLSALWTDGQEAHLQEMAELLFRPVQGDADEADTAVACEILDLMMNCTGYQGTVGSSLKSASGACMALDFAVEANAAERSAAELAREWEIAYSLLSAERAEELLYNIASINTLVESAFADPAAAEGVFEDAGNWETMSALLAAVDAHAHWDALMAAAGVENLHAAEEDLMAAVPQAEYAAENPYMQAAIDEARIGIFNAHGGPFGCVIVKDGEIVGRGHNRVLLHHNSTNHGEMEAIRDAEDNLDTYNLSGCELYTTGEPCTMCLAACLWARLDKVYYGCTIADNSEIGFDDGVIDEIFAGRDKLEDFLEEMDRDACLELFAEYNELDATIY